MLKYLNKNGKNMANHPSKGFPQVEEKIPP